MHINKPLKPILIFLLLSYNVILPPSPNKSTSRVVMSQTFVILTEYYRKEHAYFMTQNSIISYTMKYIFIVYLFGVIYIDMFFHIKLVIFTDV